MGECKVLHKGKTARSDEYASETKGPRYIEHSVWTDADTSPLISPTATCTLSDEPLPRPSLQEFSNLDAMQTTHDNPHLFEIVTPINVNKFEKLLETHPNKLFVKSICISFHEGFWPG